MPGGSGTPGSASPAGEDPEQPRRPPNGPPSLPPGPGCGGPGPGPARGPQRLPGSPLPPAPLPPLSPPPRPGRHSLREGGAARGLRVTYVDVLRHHAGRGRTRSANPCGAWPRPWGPVRRGGGREPPGGGGFGAPRAAPAFEGFRGLCCGFSQ